MGVGSLPLRVGTGDEGGGWRLVAEAEGEDSSSRSGEAPVAAERAWLVVAPPPLRASFWRCVMSALHVSTQSPYCRSSWKLCSNTLGETREGKVKVHGS